MAGFFRNMFWKRALPKSDQHCQSRDGIEKIRAAGKRATAMPKMKAALGTKCGSAHHCQARCIKCGVPVVLLLPEGPIRGQRAQIVNKYQCRDCGQSIYATTCTTGQAVLAAGCSIVNDQMQFVNPVELEFDDDVTYGGPKLFPIPLVVGRGKDGNMTLLSP